jgi:N-alpha-acetyltransferase 10/11
MAIPCCHDALSGRGVGRRCRHTRSQEQKGPDLNVYYVAEVQCVLGRAPAMSAAVTVRPVVQADVPALAGLYLRAFGSGTQSLDDAAAEMRSAFEGTWGVLWPQASPSAWIAEALVAVVQAVHRPSRASMPGAPDCPWLIDVFTDPRHRRIGLARSLIAASCRVMEAAGEDRVGLTVDDDNVPALALYKSLGFSKAM